MKGFLNLLLEELDVPLYISVSLIARNVHAICPPLESFKSALLNAGYQVSISHCHPLGIKTNAPMTFLYDILKEWIKSHPVHSDKHASDSVAMRILQKPMM